MNNILFYYSTNTYLSHLISKMFYNETFYVWCSPVFNPASLDKLNPLARIPQSSSPHDIYQELKRDVASSDLHSARIESNKIGLKRGAAIALTNDIISEEEYSRIEYIIDNSIITDFKPLLYIIHAEKVIGKIIKPEVSKMANPLSTEYIIGSLKSNEFDLIQF